MPIDDSRYTTEAGLIRACVEQDRKAQRMLYEKYSSRMYSVCVRYAGDRQKAKDYLQDGFITVFSKIGSYTGEGSFEGWMRKIFVNTALMQIRKNDVLRGTQEISEMKTNIPFEDNLMGQIGGKDIFKLIKEMPDGFRTVFNLSVVDGFSHQEIAKQLGISEGASRSQLSRARGWLQEKIIKMEKEKK